DGLDLGRIDIEAGSNDHLLGAADDVHLVALEAGEIAGVEPAVRIDRLGREIGRTVVTAHDVGPADVELTNIAIGDDRAVATDKARLEARDDRSDRAVFPRRVGTHPGNSRRTFRDAEGIEQGEAE